jgi:hypothetical protein
MDVNTAATTVQKKLKWQTKVRKAGLSKTKDWSETWTAEEVMAAQTKDNKHKEETTEKKVWFHHNSVIPYNYSDTQ